MLERSRARRQAVQILYQREITAESAASILEARSFNPEEGEPTEFCRALLEGVEEHQTAIDEALADVSEHWAVSRMPMVDRSILRLAVYEILYVDDIPDSVSINEAVEMAKVYGGDDSSKFVNGVLGRVAEVRRESEEDGADTEDG